MALSESVEASLKEAESNLRNALAYAARQERPVVCGVIADLINKIDNLQSIVVCLVTFLMMMNEL
jgi:hypothetical protein